MVTKFDYSVNKKGFNFYLKTDKVEVSMEKQQIWN